MFACYQHIIKVYQEAKIRVKSQNVFLFLWNPGCCVYHTFQQLKPCRIMNSMKLVIPYWSIHTKDESKRGTAFAFIFGVYWLWPCGVTALFGVFFSWNKMYQNDKFNGIHDESHLTWHPMFYHEGLYLLMRENVRITVLSLWMQSLSSSLKTSMGTPGPLSLCKLVTSCMSVATIKKSVNINLDFWNIKCQFKCANQVSIMYQLLVIYLSHHIIK